MVDPVPYLTATGNVCHQWSYLEYLLSKAIWHLLGLDKKTGMIVTGGMDILPRVNMAIALATHLKANPSLLQALKDTRTAIQGRRKTDGLQYQRNRIVHGVYSSNKEAMEPSVETHRGAGSRQREPINLAEIQQAGTDIHAEAFKLAAVFKPLGIDCN